MKKLLNTLILFGVVTGLCLSNSQRVNAATDPFVCSANFYQVISGQLKLLNPVSGAYSDIGSNAGFTYNAIGYNTLDNYIYGIATSGPNVSNLYRVSNDGTMTDLGLPTGLPSTSTYVSGSMDLAGNLYLISAPSTVYRVNVSAGTATTLTLTGDPIAGADNVYIDNKLYMLVGTDLTTVDLSTNIASTVTVTGPSGWATTGTGFGAAWTNLAGELFFSNNGTGSIYQITNYTTASPTAVFKVTGTVTSNNDGTNCSLAVQSPFDPPAASDDSYATAYNTQVTGSVLPNDMGNALTVTANSSPAHGTLSINTDGTFVYTPSNGYSGTDSFSYTVTDSFGRTATATASITILPSAPNTGYVEPNDPNTMLIFAASMSVLSMCLGLWLIYR